MAEVRQRLIGLLDYIEQVVRLDERVAFRLSEYHLPDGSTFAIGKSDTQNLRLEDGTEVNDSIADWITKSWTAWSVTEQPRRRTIALYQVLYKIFQLMEVGGAESPIELMWGIGMVHWQKDGRIVDRPLLE